MCATGDGRQPEQQIRERIACVGLTDEIQKPARLDIPTEFIQNVTDTVILRGPASALRTLETKANEQTPT